MAKGKQTCKILKEIRKQIAEENDIELVISECTYQGDCLGTCPKCEAEVRYLEHELEKRQRMGKAAVFAGMSLGTLFATTSCNDSVIFPVQGKMSPISDSTEMTNDSIPSDTIPDEPFLLEGDVVAPMPDEWATDGLIEPWRGEDETVGSDDGVYQIVDEMPEFPGGEEKLIEFVKKSITYPEEAIEKGIQGLVFVNYTIEPDGSVSNIKVLKGLGYGCDEEAIRIVRSMPKWEPGKHNGEPVRVSYTLPVRFKLQ